MGSLGAAGSGDTGRAVWTATKGEMSQQSPEMCNHPRPRQQEGHCSRKKTGSRERPESPLPSFLQRSALNKVTSKRKYISLSIRRLSGSPFIAPCRRTPPRSLRRARPNPTHVCPQQPVSQCNCHRLVPLCKNNRRRKSTFVSSSSIDTAGRAGAGGGSSSGGPRASAHSLCSSGAAGRGKAPSSTSHRLGGHSQSIPWPAPRPCGRWQWGKTSPQLLPVGPLRAGISGRDRSCDEGDVQPRSCSCWHRAVQTESTRAANHSSHTHPHPSRDAPIIPGDLHQGPCRTELPAHTNRWSSSSPLPSPSPILPSRLDMVQRWHRQTQRPRRHVPAGEPGSSASPVPLCFQI